MNKERKRKGKNHTPVNEAVQECVPSYEIGFVIICFFIIKGLIRFVIPF